MKLTFCRNNIYDHGWRNLLKEAEYEGQVTICNRRCTDEYWKLCPKQPYVIVDEKTITAPTGEGLLDLIQKER